MVVATHGRSGFLGRLVGALEAQDLDVPFEVVVVDDASPDDTWDELGRLALVSTVPVRPLRLARQSGPAVARNRGWRAARGSLVAFTDDDCVPQPGWLSHLVGGLQVADVVQGRTVPIPEKEAGRGPFARSVWVEHEDGRYETANVGYHRSLLEQVGGFDERFRRPFGEDIDLAWRARELGGRTLFVPDALVHHEVFASRWWDHVRETRRRGAVVAVVARHPGFRAHLYRPRLYREGHSQAVLAAAGLAVAGHAGARSLVRRGPGRSWAPALVAGALLASPYGRYRLVSHPLPCRPRYRLPVAAMTLVADLAEIAALASASVRYRTLLL